jgi:hypothetical protein
LLVILLISNCQKETLEPFDPLPAKKGGKYDEPKNNFFTGFTTGTDQFKNFVVAQLQLLEQQTPFIGNFLTTRGAPMWNLAITRSYSGYVLLLVPVKHPSVDKVNALMAFVGTSTKTTFTTFDLGISYPGFERVEDYLALYHQAAFNERHPDIPKMIKTADGIRGDSNTKYYLEITNCYEVWTGTLENPFQFYSYTSCTTSYVWVNSTIPSISLNVIWGGGGGGTNPSGPPSGSTSVSPSQLLPIKKILEKEFCPNKHILANNLWNSVTFYINPNVPGNGGYNADNGWVFFKGDSYIKGSTLLHEMFHAFQHSLYGDEYPAPGAYGSVNVEFEAWLYTDLWAHQSGEIASGNHSSWVGKLPQNLYTQYFDWLNEIIANPNELNNESNYLTWLTRFNQYMPEYSSDIDAVNNRNPHHIILAYMMCNLIN